MPGCPPIRTRALDDKQQILREIVQTAVFEGRRIRIRGAAPLKMDGSRRISQPPAPSAEEGVPSSSRIAATRIKRRDRNPGGKGLTQIQVGRRESTTSFQLMRAIPPALGVRSRPA